MVAGERGDEPRRSLVVAENEVREGTRVAPDRDSRSRSRPLPAPSARRLLRRRSLRRRDALSWRRAAGPSSPEARSASSRGSCPPPSGATRPPPCAGRASAARAPPPRPHSPCVSAAAAARLPPRGGAPRRPRSGPVPVRRVPPSPPSTGSIVSPCPSFARSSTSTECARRSAARRPTASSRRRARTTWPSKPCASCSGATRSFRPSGSTTSSLRRPRRSATRG